MKLNAFRYTPLVLALTCMVALSLTSCFGEEPDYCEADIETATLHVDDPSQFFFQATDSMQTVFSTDSVITFAVRGDADVSALAPVFKLSRNFPGRQVATPLPRERGSDDDYCRRHTVLQL